MPILMPILSGIVNMLDEFDLLVSSPLECVLDAISEQLNKINVDGTTQKQINQLQELKKEADPQAAIEIAIGLGLTELYKATADGRNYIKTKAEFYTTAFRKAIKDYTGDSQNYLQLAAQKQRALQLIRLIASIIELKKKEQLLCQPGQTPSQRELNNFFNNFFNPNSRFKIAIDPDGTIRVEEDAPILYQIEEPGKGAKILEYEPEDLLKKPAMAVFRCSFHTNASDVGKVNKWIQELNTV